MVNRQKRETESSENSSSEEFLWDSDTTLKDIEECVAFLGLEAMLINYRMTFLMITNCLMMMILIIIVCKLK